MKVHFSFFSDTLYRNLLICGIIVCFVACNNKQQKHPRPEFTLDTPGGKIAEMWNDTTPKVVYYYKLDEEGIPSQERIGVAEFYQNQQEYRSGGLKDGKWEGKCYAFFRDGSVQAESFYVDGKLHGAYNLYRENGKPFLKGHYSHDICDGTWTWYDEAGKQTKKIKADKNTIACEWCAKCLQLKQK
jgi:hypothetical protein